MNENIVKALRCLASNSPDGDCYMDFYNMEYAENGRAMQCGNRSKDKITCPFCQTEFGTCFEDGDCSAWLRVAAEIIENKEDTCLAKEI